MCNREIIKQPLRLDQHHTKQLQLQRNDKNYNWSQQMNAKMLQGNCTFVAYKLKHCIKTL